MGLFDRFRRTNAVQINQIDTTSPHIVWNGWNFMGFKPSSGILFGETYLWVCLERIIKGLSNVTFTTSKDTVVTNKIVAFIENNATLLFNSYVKFGYIAVHYDKDYNYSLLSVNDIKKDQYGRIINADTVVVYSPEYQLHLKTPIVMCRPILEMLDKLCGTMVATTNTLNVLPIISSNAIPADPSFKKSLSDAMSREYGWGESQMKYFLSRSEVKVDALDLGVDKLELRDNILAKFKELLNYWNIPLPLVIDDASTYNNIVEARREFYGTCVRFYAEVLLKVGQYLLTASNEYIPQKTLNYAYSNIPEMESTISGFCAEKGAYIDLLKKFADAGIDVTDELGRVYVDVRKKIQEI